MPLIQCNTCDGTGQVHSHNPKCWDCNGTGQVPSNSSPTSNQQPIQIGPDGWCNCSCSDVCPLGKTGMGARCTRAQLNQQGIPIRQLSDMEQDSVGALKDFAENFRKDALEDPINNKVECMEAIKESSTREEYKGFLKGQVLKYIRKGTHQRISLQDLQKASWHLDRLINFIQEKE